jgi:N-glycosylase/DNA lyase
MALVRLLACRDYSTLPLDRWLRRLASAAYSVPEAAAGQELRRRFGAYTGLAALHTTIGFDAEPISRALERLREGKNKPGLADPSPMSLWRHTPPPV